MVRKLISLSVLLFAAVLFTAQQPSYSPGPGSSGGGSTPTSDAWTDGSGYISSTLNPATANQFTVFGVPTTGGVNVEGTTMTFDITTGDGGGAVVSDIGFATGTSGGTCTLQSHVSSSTSAGVSLNTTGAQSLTLHGNAGVMIPTLSGQQLYFVETSTGSALVLGAFSSSLDFAEHTVTGTTSGGSLGTPGTTTFTCPTNDPVQGADALYPAAIIGP